jgi:ribonuclease BN (tRNA processing enzyme)
LTEVVFVGTSDAFGAGGRRQSAILVRAPEGTVLLDCGVTTATGLVDLGVEREELDAILVSHYHGDHFGGIPQILLACLYEDARRRPLWIAGPQGIEERVRSVSAALGYPLEEREWTFPMRFAELQPGEDTPVGPAMAGVFETHHQRDVCPHGLSLQAGGERIVFSGDTGWFASLPHHARGAGLFICECTFLESGFEYHLSLEEISERRTEFDCGRIILTHLGREMSERRGSCEFETADDGLVLRL